MLFTRRNDNFGRILGAFRQRRKQIKLLGIRMIDTSLAADEFALQRLGYVRHLYSLQPAIQPATTRLTIRCGM